MALVPLQGIRPGSTPAQFERTRQLFVRGYLEKCQTQAEGEYWRSRNVDPLLASKYLLLEAETMLWRGLNQDALNILSRWSPSDGSTEELIRERTLEGVAWNHLQDSAKAEERFREADLLCAQAEHAACGGVLRARGVMSISRGDLVRAHEELLASLAYARKYGDALAQATAFLNLGVAALHADRFDDAVDWSNSAYRASTSLGSEDLAQNALGNLGWAYFKLGDSERALQLFAEAEKEATRLGDTETEIRWLATTAYVHQNRGDLDRALKSDLQCLTKARAGGSKEDILNALEDLAHISIRREDLSAASRYVDMALPLVQSSGNRLDRLDLMLAEAAVNAGQRQDAKAEQILREVDSDPVAETSMKLDAERQLAHLYEARGDLESTEKTYREALRTFERARDQLRDEDSKLPFLNNANGIYDDYIHFLISQHKPDDALLIADQSRALTLAQGLGIHSNDKFGRIPKTRPTEVARRAGATLLFYWLGAKQSYLWTISAKGISLYNLPPEQQIKQSIDRYRTTLQGLVDSPDTSDRDGRALYDQMLAPASASLPLNGSVIILSDGPLSQLNFETLIVPAPHPHYFIEDATVSSAPSLQMLASTRPANTADRRLLLIGDAVSPGPDYPNLPMASSEMQKIQQQIGPRNAVLFARENATPAAYLSTGPQQFAYVHFVAHGVASPTDPLDSAIILSRSSSAEDSFKLHARDIIQHPIGARLVTISACYGSGARSFAGEGPVGLAWAFLRAGAHNVIGALWEVSDQSAPQMMSDLYSGLNSGLSPSAALRQAKLQMLHSSKEFRKPFYWAPLQLYTGL